MDEFSYVVDGVTLSAVAVVSITINAVNDSPEGEDIEVVVTEDIEYEFRERF